MHVGMIISEATPLTWDRWRHLVGLTDRLGLRSLFRPDHFFNGTQKDTIDPYLLFAATGMESTNIRFGPLVSPITFRPPVIVGRMAQQLDALSDGRFVLGLGAGWFEAEHRIFGLDWPPLKERYDRLEEAIEMMKVLWYETDGVYNGKYYQLDGTDSQPHPPAGRPPILIGGTGPKRTLRLVARFADEWNSQGLAPDAYAEKIGILEDHCADVGRDPQEIRRSMLMFTTCGPSEEIRRMVSERMGEMRAPGAGKSMEDLAAEGSARGVFMGSTEELIDRLGQLGELGLEEIIISHFVTERDDFPEWLAGELAPAVQSL